ncbi:hypothetical protein Avbf_01720 [Armadillidium vulgare]|nr:hypothetical protein Avbf_01720 [Armadillidium vulgare]
MSPLRFKPMPLFLWFFEKKKNFREKKFVIFSLTIETLESTVRFLYYPFKLCLTEEIFRASIPRLV